MRAMHDLEYIHSYLYPSTDDFHRSTGYEEERTGGTQNYGRREQGGRENI